MRKQFLLLMALCLAVGQSWAERIDVATAREVARTVASRGSTLRSAGELSLVYAAAPGQTGSALRSASAAGEADYFVFNVPGDGGFVIVAGDDRVRPVLGYSHTGSFDPDNLPENLRGMLAYYQNQITWAEDNAVEASPAISAEWSQYQSGTALRAVGNGVLLETANWGQGEPYNRMTPEISGQHAVTGCVATAMGIIMYHHKYPAQAVNPPESNTYYVNKEKTTVSISYDNYDWVNMLPGYKSVDYTDAQADAVAKLLYHCGANVGMKYATNESSSHTKRIATALSDVFGYSPSIRYLVREAYRWDEWKAMLRAELDAGYPLIYDGSNPGTGGAHAFVCDGYSPDGLFHINWGWNGGSNGYYQLSVLDDDGDGYGYSDSQGAVLNIRPEQSGERYYIRPYLTQAQYSKNGSGVSATNMELSYYGGDHVFFMELGVVDANGSIVQKPASKNELTLTGYDEGYVTFTVKYRNITLENELSEGQYITLLCSADGENWEVMRATEDVPLGIGADGVINPSEDDPNEPEQPMIVSVNWNHFDDNFLGVTGLDNNQYAYDNVQGIAYGFSGNISDATIRYTITNYAEWKDQIAIYYGDYSIGASGAGTLVTIGSDGSFEIHVPQSDFEYGDSYVNYMKVLSDKAGELAYTIEVYSGESESPLLKEEGHSMAFIGDVTPNFSSNPLRGAVDTELPFSFSIVAGADALIGKSLTLDITLFSTDLTPEDIQLLGPDKQTVALGESSGSLYTQTPIALGSLAMKTDYSLTLKSAKEIAEANNASLALDLAVDGKSLPLTFNVVRLIVDPAGASTYSVTANFTGLSLRSGSTTSVEEGGEVLLYLNVDDTENYQLPSTITVTMGGVTLTQGEGYFYEGNTISIPNVTGDIVVTAVAEPIPATTYTISAGQMENLTANLPISVLEGEKAEFTIMANEGYLVPETITVKFGESTLNEAYYTYTPSEDRKSATLTIERVPSDLQIYAIAVAEPKTFTITGTFTNVRGTSQDFSQPIELEEGLDFIFTLDAVEGYRVPAHITIVNTDTNTPLVEGVDYTYDRQSDVYAFITVSAVNSNLAITAVGEQIGYYGVALKLEGVVATPGVIENQFAENTEGVSFEVDFTAAEGYNDDVAITVMMGDVTLSADEYTYENGTFTLNTPITGTLTITAKAEKKTYPIKIYANHATTDVEEGTMVPHGGSITIKVTPNEGYEFLFDEPSSISVSINGVGNYTDWNYNEAQSTITINNVPGPLNVELSAMPKEFTLMNKLTNLTATPESGTQIKYGEPLEVTLAVTDATLYALPKTITVMMAGVELETTEYSYNATTGVVRIEKVTGDVWITAEGLQIHTVSDGGEHVTINSDGIVTDGGTYSGTIVPASGYKLPETITVLIGGKVIYPGQYTYDKETGAIEIRDVTGPITIIATAVPEGRYEVVLTLSHLVSSPASFEPVAEGEPVELTLSAASGYELPSSIQVTMGGTALTVGTDYTYNATTGAFKLESITGTLVITANGKLIPTPDPDPDPTPGPDPTPTPATYTVTLPVVEGATVEAVGSTSVEAGDSFSFTVTVKEGYVATNMVVKANGVTLTPNADGRYTIANVRSNVVVTVTGIEEDPATAIESVDASGLKVWAADGRLFIQTPRTDKAYVVTFDGRLYKALDLPVGETVTPMPQGAYIIYVGERSFKVVL